MFLENFSICTACGVNYSQDCWQNLSFSLAQQGVTRPPPDAYYQLCFLPDTFAPWLNIGQWTDPPAFIRYLLDLYQLYPQKSPNQSPIVYYQCNNCHVDMEFRLADAELFQILAKAMKDHQRNVSFLEDQIRSFESFQYLEQTLPISARTFFPASSVKFGQSTFDN